MYLTGVMLEKKTIKDSEKAIPSIFRRSSHIEIINNKPTLIITDDDTEILQTEQDITISGSELDRIRQGGF